DRYPHQLSGGMRQRVMIAMASSCQPRSLIADEPTTASDVTIQAQISNSFMDSREQLNSTYSFISHDSGVVEHSSDRVVIMYSGRVVETAPVDEVFRRPNHPYTQASSAEIPNSKSRHKTFTAIKGEIPSPSAPPSGCAFRTRCPQAQARCAQETPVARPVGAGQSPFDYSFVGGTVIDGANTPGQRADVGVRGDRIAAIGDSSDAPARHRID
ncbi:hypothetical protein OY671_008939, partial [Metschnikowia pulcherrima]